MADPGKVKRFEYFEAVLQLRNPTPEVLSCVYNALKKRGTVNIAKEIPHKNGVDLYLSSQRFTRSIGRILKKSFHNGTLVESKKTYGVSRQTSKVLYRGTVMFRINQPDEDDEEDED